MLSALTQEIQAGQNSSEHAVMALETLVNVTELAMVTPATSNKCHQVHKLSAGFSRPIESFQNNFIDAECP